MDNRAEWNAAKDGLVKMVRELGLPEEFGYEIAKNLGSPKAIRRMTAYLSHERPKDPVTVVDEMLAIRSQIDAWKQKKASESVNPRYNQVVRYGLDTEDE